MGRVGQGLTPLSPLRTARADFSASGSSTLNAYGQRTKYCKLLDFTIITIRDIPALYISSQPNLIGVFTCMRCTTLLGLDCWSTLTFLLLFSFNAYYRFLVPEHLHRKSAQLSLEVMLIISVLHQKKSQLLSASLQNGIRFFLHPLPAPPSLGIASFLLPRKKGERYGLTKFRVKYDVDDLAPASTPRELLPACHEYSSLTALPFVVFDYSDYLLHTTETEG